MADKKGGNVMAAGIAGMAVGAAVGAAAVALRDPKTRRQAVKTLGEIRKQTATRVNQLKASTFPVDTKQIAPKSPARKAATTKKDSFEK